MLKRAARCASDHRYPRDAVQALGNHDRYLFDRPPGKMASWDRPPLVISLARYRASPLAARAVDNARVPRPDFPLPRDTGTRRNLLARYRSSRWDRRDVATGSHRAVGARRHAIPD